MGVAREQVVEALRTSVKETERLRQENRRLLAASREPVAIVGMSCRYPGSASSPRALWELLLSGGEAISGLPSDRGWDLKRLYDPDPDSPGTIYIREGAFLRDVGEFDAEFFKISPREALAMDPHQRLLLEASWEAFEDAGIDPVSLRASQTGVFAGAMHQDYGAGLQADGDGRLGGSPSGDLEGHLITGGAASVVSGRVAYVLGLEGPAITIDTACSSSLVAIHLACQALRGGECTMALAGGVTVLSTPTVIVEFSRQRGLAPDGRCKPFADAADGTSVSEGVGLVALERLSDARRLGHRVLALIRGSAVNQDGASNGLTAPNGPSQRRVIRRALAHAGLSPEQVDVVEAHGTGTALGDPIEAQALLATYGRERPAGRPLWLGSVKSNLGHTQAAAGVAGVIKMVLALQRETLPATLHVDRPTGKVDWSSGAISLLREAVAWPRNGEPRRAAVSSFGISGTNSHLILEEAPPLQTPEGEVDAGGGVLGAEVVPWVLSGRHAGALRAQAERLRGWIEGDPRLEERDVGLSLAASRSAFAARGVVVGAERGELLAGLTALGAGESAAGVVVGAVAAGGGGRVAFVFPGQGSQWAGMALELLDASPRFAERIGECGAALAPFVDWALEDVLRGAPGAPGLERVDVVQPALFAVMVSLAGLWRDCGVHPDAVIGHSQGEIAAVCVAGGMSLPDAAQLVALRSRALARLAGEGGMVSIAAGLEPVRGLLERWGDAISVAAVNGPASVVVSGEPGALQELLGECESEGVRARRIPVDYAAHSAQVKEIREELLQACAAIEPRSGEVPFYSSVSGGPLDMHELDAGYWYRNLRETVWFERAARSALSEGCETFIEVGPHPVLGVALQETLESVPDGETGEPRDCGVLGSLRRGEGGPRRLLSSLGEAWVRGAPVDWGAVFRGSGARRVSLPTYAFQRRRYWPDSPPGGVGDLVAAGQAPAGHPLLGAALARADGEGWLFTGCLSLETHPWLADHRVMGAVLLPGTGFLELALHVGARVGCERVQELVLAAPLVLGEDGRVQLQVSLAAPDEGGCRALSIHSRPADAADAAEEDVQEGEWTRHADGVLAPGDAASERAELAERAGVLAYEPWPPPDAQPVPVEDLYERLAELGLQYGPAFQGLRAAWRRGEEVLAEVCLPEQQRAQAGRFGLHPALLDAALHGLGIALVGAEGAAAGGVRLPFSWSGVGLYAEGAGALRACLAPRGDDAVSLVVADETGTLVAAVSSLVARPVSPEQLAGGRAARRESLFHIEWTPVEVTAEEAASEGWAVLGGGARRLASSLAAAGVGGAGGGEGPAVYADLDALAAAIAQDGAPATVLVDCRAEEEGPRGAGLPEAAHARVRGVVALMQAWLAEERLAAARLVLVTRGAVAVQVEDWVGDLSGAPIWGLVRCAQAEHPGCFVLLDVDESEDSPAVAAGALALEEPQLAVRGGVVCAPRLARSGAGEALVPPAQAPQWRLQAGGAGTLEDLHLVACPEAGAPLGPGQVRVAVRAAGLGFRDVVSSLGLVPLRGEWDTIGSEGAGLVLEVAPDVGDLEAGDRVTGLFTGAFGPVAVADRRALARMPQEWSFVQGATVPGAFLTAYYGLVDLARVQPGESVLVHAAAGGVGMAAVQLARHLGAEVLATASPWKWEAVRALGVADGAVASSRDAQFRDRFLQATDGRGVDVVLSSLKGELVDASLELLPRGGRFLEMGKTDIRDPEEVAKAHEGVTYRAFDLIEAGPERIRELLAELLELFARGVLAPLPVRAWDVRHAPHAFRFMSQARHVGKLALTLPVPAAQQRGTALITGGTGGLGGLVARHLVAEQGVRSVVLCSRRGREAPGAAELEAELTGLGARVSVAACDVADRQELRKLIDAIPSEHPLRTVVHAAGVLEDGVLESLTAETVDRVLAPKVDAAWHLHELTAHLDLEAFVLFSSAAGTFGNAGQGAYAAANAFLDALAAHRRARGLPGVSMGWGWWSQATEMTGGLGELELERMRRAGLRAFSPEEGLELFDAARGSAQAHVLPVRLNLAALSARAQAGSAPALLRGLLRTRPRARSGEVGGSLAKRLAGVAQAERPKVVLDLVRSEVAAVLGHTTTAAVDSRRAFKDLGFDSLLAVELRNRLNAITGLRLPATLVFDYPTPSALAGHLLEKAGGARAVSVAPPRAARSAEEPVAIVGMSCRYPGGVRSPQELWEMLAAGRDAISGFPVDREWDLERLYDPDPDHPGTSYVREGGFVYDAAEFDAEFFEISPREALAMDPQQRMLLEASWEALEDAGLDPLALHGSRTGVFTGTTSQDYGSRGSFALDSFDGYLVTGNSASVLSGRVSYALGLEGPAVTVDTACSSSLVALHLACQALRGGECELALAGGVAVLSTPVAFLEFARQGGLARDARCKSFADAADGTNWGEGLGVVALERLSDARREGHRVLALVRASAVNQDGASNGLAAPNGPSQQRVIRQALANAGLQAGEVDAVEAHGTGTTLGDPIEAQALLATYGQRPAQRPLWLGSIKSNINHTQAAAGVAGVIKMVLALRNGLLPKTLHVDAPTKQVDWSAGAVSLLTEPVAWEPNGRPRRAGVSSFGVSGTNVHLILEEAPVEPAGERSASRGDSAADGQLAADGPLAAEGTAPDVAAAEPAPGEPATAGALLGGEVAAWIVSAKGRPALRSQAARLREHVVAGEAIGVQEVGLSLAARSAFGARAVVVGAEREELLAGLGALARGEAAAGVSEGVAPAGEGAGGVVFVFPGQGSQWEGMAVELLDASPFFARRIAACGAALAPFVEWELESVLRGAAGAPGLERVDVVQPALFAVTVSLAALWRECGVHPEAVVGHSQGEIAAAHVAGGLSLQDAARVVALRSRALLALAGRGGMVSLARGAHELDGLLEPAGESLSLAAVNGPSSAVVSGDPQALAKLLEACEAQGVRARRLAVDYAAHSVQVQELREALLEGCAGIAPRSAEVPFHSSVTGGPVDTAGLDGEYWYRNLRETVQFERATQGLLDAGHRTFIEVSPHPVLTVGVTETAEGALGEGAAVAALGSLRRGEGGPRRLVTSLGEAWVRGVSVDWKRALRGRAAGRVPLPTYPFQRRRYWLAVSAQAGGDPTAVGQAPGEHPLVGAVVALAEGGGSVFTGRLSLATHPWLADHAAMGTALLPGTAFLELALHAGGQVGCELVRELTLQAPLVLARDGAVKLQVSVGSPDESGERSLSVHSRPEGPGVDPAEAEREWVSHAEGVLAPRAPRAGEVQEWATGLGAKQWPPPGVQALAVEGLYEVFAEAGLERGPVFQGLRAAWRRGEELFAEVAPAEEHRADAGLFCVHPALLDAALLGAGALAAGQESEQERASVPWPSRWSEVELYARGAGTLRVHLSPGADGAMSLALADGAGAPVATARSLTLAPLSLERIAAACGDRSESLYRLDWTALPAGTPAAGERWAVLGVEGAGEQGTLRAALEPAGEAPRAYADLPALVEALGEEGQAPATVLVDCALGGEGPGAAHAGARLVLSLVQAWLAEERLVDARLVLVTCGAVAARTGEGVPGLTAAPVWGLVRSAQSEAPGRFVLVDVDGAQASWQVLQAALALEEPQLAIRDGAVLAPRLARAQGAGGQRGPAAAPRGPDAEPSTPPFDSRGTALITGGVGTLGALVARHLVAEHGVRSLVLASRRGPHAPGAAELRAELEEMGAQVSVVACDVCEREQLASVISAVPPQRPLSIVVHAAGVLEDGVIESLTAEMVDRVLAPKVDAAWHLHELTAHLELSAFVLFSSVTGTLGGLGQGNYAAANTFLDALAARRRAQGLAGVSMAWGWWAPSSELTSRPEEVDRLRVRRAGVQPFSAEEGLELFDAAQAGADALAVPVRLDLATLQVWARAGALPALLRGLVRTSAQRVAGGGLSLARRLAQAPADDREHVALELVRGEVAAVLGHSSAAAVDPKRAFKELGFDSLLAVELRNRLSAATELRLPATLVFDYPTTAALASHLMSRVALEGEPAGSAVEVALDGLQGVLASLGEAERPAAAVRLQTLLAGLVDGGEAPNGVSVAQRLRSASDEEIFGFIDEELGSPDRTTAGADAKGGQ